jgi:hypothetical protein
VQKVGEYIRFVCPLDKRLGEFAAIIGARAWSQQFEWWAHYRQALEAGLKREIADAVAEGRRPAGMAEDEELVYDTLTELINSKGLSDPTYARAVAKFGGARRPHQHRRLLHDAGDGDERRADRRGRRQAFAATGAAAAGAPAVMSLTCRNQRGNAKSRQGNAKLNQQLQRKGAKSRRKSNFQQSWATDHRYVSNREAA